MNGKLALLFALSALVLASTGCASRCRPRCGPPCPAPCETQPVPCQPPITRFTLTNDSGETISGVKITVNPQTTSPQTFLASQNGNVWTRSQINVDDVAVVRVEFTWNNLVKSETITLGGNKSTDPAGTSMDLPLYLMTINLVLNSCPAPGDFKSTLVLSVGTPPQGLMIP